MSNMLYACSILYKTKLPFVLVFNKTDVVDHHFATDWMTSYEKFSAALQADSTYMSSLTRSMSLVLDEFYANLRCVGVSAVTGAGVDELFQTIDEAKQEYLRDYLPLINQRIEERVSALAG
jgi:translation initiation factor IF-2